MSMECWQKTSGGDKYYSGGNNSQVTNEKVRRGTKEQDERNGGSAFMQLEQPQSPLGLSKDLCQNHEWENMFLHSPPATITWEPRSKRNIIKYLSVPEPPYNIFPPVSEALFLRAQARGQRATPCLVCLDEVWLSNHENQYCKSLQSDCARFLFGSYLLCGYGCS